MNMSIFQISLADFTFLPMRTAPSRAPYHILCITTAPIVTHRGIIPSMATPGLTYSSKLSPVFTVGIKILVELVNQFTLG